MIFFRKHLWLFFTVMALGTGAHAETAPATGSANKAAPKPIVLNGKVVETMDGGGYTYVLLKGASEKVWVAIPLTKVSVGQELSLAPGYELKNFTSKALNRKFDRLIFSAGTDTNKINLSPSAIKMAHESLKQPQPLAPAPAPAPAAAAPKKAPAPVVVKKVAKAKGPNSYTIAELYAKRVKLERKPVVVRGKVVQVSPRILKRNWIHIQDGSGSVANKTNDIAITTHNLPKEGDVITARGVLYNRIDLGSGYRFELLIQDAKLK